MLSSLIGFAVSSGLLVLLHGHLCHFKLSNGLGFLGFPFIQLAWRAARGDTGYAVSEPRRFSRSSRLQTGPERVALLVRVARSREALSAWARKRSASALVGLQTASVSILGVATGVRRRGGDGVFLHVSIPCKGLTIVSRFRRLSNGLGHFLACGKRPCRISWALQALRCSLYWVCRGSSVIWPLP